MQTVWSTRVHLKTRTLKQTPRCEFLISSVTAPRLAPELTQRRIQCEPGVSFGVKRSQREPDLSATSSSKVKNTWIYLSIYLSLYLWSTVLCSAMAAFQFLNPIRSL
jgi:hypothetical protein